VFANGATNNATYRRIIRPNSSSFHTGVRDTGVRFYWTSNSNNIAFNENEFHVQDIVARVTTNSGSDRAAFSCSTASPGVSSLVGCIATNSQNAGAGACQGFFLQAAGSARVIDCLGDNNEGHQYRIVAGTPSLYNCTAIGGTHGFIQQTAGTPVLKNCLAWGTSTADFSGTLTCTNCGSEDATADDNGGSGNRVSQSFNFLASGSNNYHLANNDTGALGFGTDLSADGTYAFNDDIDRQTISGTWNIGFDWVPADFSYKGFTRGTAIPRAATI
jgi:hypothetical protein